jgi:hypothetical protein
VPSSEPQHIFWEEFMNYTFLKLGIVSVKIVYFWALYLQRNASLHMYTVTAEQMLYYLYIYVYIWD